VLAALVCAAAVFTAAYANAADIGSLEGKVSGAQGEAAQIAEELRGAQEELGGAQREADAAKAHEAHLDGLLSEGEARVAELREAVARSTRHLAAEHRRLIRAKGVLSRRLVSIYEGGSPDTAELILATSDYEKLAVQADYLSRIAGADEALAVRVGEVRDEVRGDLDRVSALERKADAYDERLASARDEISAVRAGAEEAAAHLQAVSASRQTELSKLKSRIGEWVGEIEAAEAASHEEAEETVGRWLGGPYSIPTYIVMCESGGDYGAVNPSSGAGGAYQILPSTWELYGGQGAPNDAPKAEQDRIAGEIWADSGPSAWVCG
jgi:septal ring factor EnvC (AmiA/AmiB activator)